MKVMPARSWFPKNRSEHAIFFRRNRVLTRCSALLHLGTRQNGLATGFAGCDLWQFGSSISFGFGRHAIVTGNRKGRAIKTLGGNALC
jgi:hypothetical protein